MAKRENWFPVWVLGIEEVGYETYAVNVLIDSTMPQQKVYTASSFEKAHELADRIVNRVREAGQAIL